MTTYDLHCLVVHNRHDRGIQAYACTLTGEQGETLHELIGSVQYPNPTVVLMQVLHEMVWWCWQNLRPGSEITIYTQCPNLLSDVSEHPPLLDTKRVYDSIRAKLHEFKWHVKNIRESLDILRFCGIIDAEASKPVEEALIEDESRLKIEMKLDRVEEVFWDGRMCGTVIAGVYRSLRGDQHFCYKYQAWGIQKAIVDRLEKMHVHTLKIIHRKPGRRNIRYVLTTQEFKAYAITTCLNPHDGIQMFVPVWRWRVEK